MKVLVSWVGAADLKAATGLSEGIGPVAAAATSDHYELIHLLSNFDRAEGRNFVAWLAQRSTATIEITQVQLASPMDFGAVFEAAGKVVDELVGNDWANELSFNISPGTSAMATAWIIIATTKTKARLLQASIERGVEEVSFPFDLSAELIKQADHRLIRMPTSSTSDPARFGQLLFRSASMQRVIRKAQRVAGRSVPVLLEGESGTGKELIARAIHDASPRASASFIVINCGAIPQDLVESILFGHRKGAFTGAVADRAGAFLAAHEGTLFLDEIGELHIDAQVKLLRVLQEGEVVRLGDTRPQPVDVRIIAATNRKLAEEISAGRFREDLFYRLAVAVLKVPPLRDREGDLSLLVDRLLDQVNDELDGDPGYCRKKVSPSAKNLLLRHSWPGNVRELLNTLRRAAVWSEVETLEADDIADAILDLPVANPDQAVLGRRLGDGFSLAEVMAEVASDYLRRGLSEAAGNKSEAARLLGFSSHQTLSNWLKKYELME